MEHMKSSPIAPNEKIASAAVASMTNEIVLSSNRMATGDQHFVFAIQTEKSEYVLRMTSMDQKRKFISGIYWQEKLIPLGVPLAKFIKTDLNAKYSPFPALLMMRLLGDDLCNIYSSLTNFDKKNLANEMVKIQAATNELPDGLSFGITDSYETLIDDKSWYCFLLNRLKLFRGIIKENGIFDENGVTKVILITKDMEENFRKIRARPFLWDATERNVIVHKGKISGIVDVDDICFGDPLLVLGLTYAALENEGHDTLYTDYWAEALQLNKNERRRLAFYRLFYTVVFMRKHAMTTANRQKVNFDVHRLKNMFQQALIRINEF
jgi:hypothetical protein